MSATFHFFIIFIFSMFLPFFMHIIVVRLFRLFREPALRQKALMMSCGFGILPLTGVFLIWLVNSEINCWDGLRWPGPYLFLAYTLSSYIYFNLFNMSEAEVRIKILMGCLSSTKESALKEEYTAQAIIANRMSQLVALGQLKLCQGRYLLKSKFLLLPAKIIFALRAIIFPPHKTDWRPLLFFIAVIGLMGILNHFSLWFKSILYPYHNECVAVFVALVSLVSFSLMSKDGRSFSDYLLLCIPYIMVAFRFLLLQVVPACDGVEHHFPAFRYIAGAIAKGNFFPEWFPSSGGIRTGFFHISYFISMPSRVLAYYLYSIIPVPAVFIYKAQFILGIIVMCFGWWLVLHTMTRCRYSAYLGTLMVMMGGTGITFHQEQVLATTYLMPWFVLSLLKIKENTTYIFPLVIICGLGLSTHQPQIQLFSMGLTVFLMGALHLSSVKKIFAEQKQNIPLLLLLFALAILPSYYIFCHVPLLVSPLRATGASLYPASYQEYLSLNQQQCSSAPPTYYLQYLLTAYDPTAIKAPSIDAYSFFVGRIALVFAFAGLLLNFRKTIPVFILSLTFASLTLGINCVIPLPEYLYKIHFPLMNVFRQWFHFFPTMNFCLSIFAALGFAALVRYLKKKPQWFFSAAIMLILFLQVAEFALYDRRYLSVCAADATSCFEDFASYFLEKPPAGPSSIFEYVNRCRLQDFAEAIPPDSFLTNEVAATSGGEEEEYDKVAKLQFGGGKTTVANTPLPLLRAFLSEDKAPDIFYQGLVDSYGLSLNLIAPQPSLLATPLNYDLHATAYIDGRRTVIWRVNSAFCGVLVGKGEHKIKFIIQPDTYRTIFLIQMFLYAFLFIFFISRNIKTKISK